MIPRAAGVLRLPPRHNRETQIETDFTLSINGRRHEVTAPEDMPLLWVLRESLGLTCTKCGCGVGACTVHLDGMATRSCQIAVADVGEGQITTIEAIGATPEGRAVQDACRSNSRPEASGSSVRERRRDGRCGCRNLQDGHGCCSDRRTARWIEVGDLVECDPQARTRKTAPAEPSA
ncbi:(2Fe-2S)-binding domain-containing protein [Celeribacter indicus]|uniref:(2Fe-2S)-binding domain-containing protein n=1 Tax=Celeribacter indicus TaxID=1208324 RepID=A0A0B5DTB6_9RHOB|nr:(2Fe-2S)-binding domain-containing protein [Celeribacter indicus]